MTALLILNGLLIFFNVSSHRTGSDDEQVANSLTLSTTPGCTDVTNWQGFPLANWLHITPASGQLQPGVNTNTTLLIDAGKLAPGIYRGWLDLLTEFRSQTLLAQVTVVSSASAIGVLPGASSPGLSNSPAPGGPSNTVVPGGPTAGATSTVVPGDPTVGPTSTATPGTPFPSTTPVPGTPTPTPSPQPCTLQVAPANLTFIASLLQSNPPGQQLLLTTTNCARAVTWTASVNATSQNWLHLSATSGMLHNNRSIIVVNVNANGKLLGNYTGQISLTAVEQDGVTAQGSPQHISVTLTVIL